MAAQPVTVPTPPEPLDPDVLRGWAGSIRGPVILPSDEAFDSARAVWNRAIDVRPAAIVRCADEHDVANAIEFARGQNVALAVRSGGHSQAGLGTCNDGLVLDLGSLRTVAVDATERIARVAAGARVSDVIDATQAYGLLTPMGGCPDVGVGGLTLGGGETFLMARYAAVCDNLLAARLITADGDRLTVSGTEHPDLFWALRGGGGNFGIVTSFEYRLYPVTDVLAGQLLFRVDRARDAMRRYRDLMREATDDLSTSGGLSPLPDGPSFFLSVCFCGADRADGNRLVTHWIDTLKPDDQTVRWGPFSSELSVPAAPSVGTGRFLPALTDQVIEILAKAFAAAPPAASAVWNDFHGAVTRVPVDATAFPLRQRGFDLFISVPWTTPADRDVAIGWSSQLAERLAPFGRGVYVNNLNETEASRVREAYGSNYDRLVAIKRRYDPANVFRINHNIPPTQQ